jgi:hypothetical protein
MKTRLYCIIVFTFCAGLAALWSGVHYFAPAEAPAPSRPVAVASQGRILGSVSGLSPGARVSYQVIPLDGTAITGWAQADAQGQWRIPAYDVAAPVKTMAYNIRIEKEKKEEPIDLSFKINPETGNIAVSGKGLEKFSDLAIQGAAGRIETKADWAGLFENAQKEGLKGAAAEEGFRVALYGNDAMRDIRSDNPLMITVQQTGPGGGGLGTGGVNVYDEPDDCNGEIHYGDTCTGSCPLYSFCLDNERNNQIAGIENNYVAALILMSQEFSAVMMQQMLIIGQFFDAKQQLETQRKLQQLQAEAHKDYHPSDMMCRFGTFVRSTARAEEKGAFDKQAISKTLMNSYLASSSGSTRNHRSDMEARLRQFREVYCDPQDNNNGLQFICDRDQNWSTQGEGAQNQNRKNKDIDYPRTVYFPLTINTDFTNNGIVTPLGTTDGEDVIALGRNLYWPRVFESTLPSEVQKKSHSYLDARHVFAINNVAHNSYAHIVGMKGRSPSVAANGSNAAFIKSLMREFGVPDAEIDDVVGDFPSYYAQMEILTKKIYQNPDFYTNLYDKPVNVDRIGVSMQAISLMQSRDLYEASLRREMLNSLLVEEALTKHVNRINEAISSKTMGGFQ